MKRLEFLCMYASACVFKCLKRRYLALLCCICIVGVFVIKWGFICVNMQPRKHIQNVCTNYANGLEVGNLCKELCQPEGISSMSCHNNMKKDTVFSGVWMNTPVVFKASKKESYGNEIHQLDVNKNKIYPSEDEFSKIIKSTVKSKFNISINDIDAKRMSYTQFSKTKQKRHVEMENVWSLLQNNEYLALSLYEKFDIFPKLIGTCGSLYAVQKLHSIAGYWHLVTLYDSKKEWVKRIKISLMILDYLLSLENGLPEPLLLCDVKMNHFGLTEDLKKIMYLDLDAVHPLSIVNKITANGNDCKQHSDCDFYDCRSFCNLISYKCQHGVVNNNLQIVCERIFLGWMSDRVTVPGLLMGPWTPRVLVELLEQCANPSSETSIPRSKATKEIRKRIHDLLTYMTLS